LGDTDAQQHSTTPPRRSGNFAQMDRCAVIEDIGAKSLKIRNEASRALARFFTSDMPPMPG